MWPEDAIVRWVADTRQLCSPPPSPPRPFSSPPPAPLLGIPTRKRRRYSATMEETEHEIDATPRPRKAMRCVTSNDSDDTRDWPAHPHPLRAPVLPSQPRHHPPPLKSAVASSSASASTSEHSFSSLTSGKRKRGTGSRSPTKRLTDRQYNTILPTDRRPIERLDDLPESLRELVKALKRLGNERGILYEGHGVSLSQLKRGFDSDDDEAIFARGDAVNARTALGKAPTLEWIERIQTKAERNSKNGASESAWNNDVHGPLLEEALYYSCHRDALLAATITTARIHPSALIGASLPKADSAIGHVNSKRVDFCIALKMNKATETAAMRSAASLNHTDYNAVRCNPIAISIETKCFGADDPEAILQLTTWGCAQVTFLRQFYRYDDISVTPLPPLPMILIAGHSWTLCFLHVADPEASEGGAILWTGLEIGNTRSALGIYCIIACLQYLYDWVEKVYRPWFESQISDPLVEGLGTFVL